MLILDFYVDEPACFGVPPYLSPYCRYAAGALVAGGIPQEKIQYLTVDQWRNQGKTLSDDHELILLVAGTTVPGKYLGGRIGTVTEVLEFIRFQKKQDPSCTILLGGPIRYADRNIQDEIRELGAYLIRGDLEVYAERMASYPGSIKEAAEAIFEKSRYPVYSEKRNYEQVDRYASRGAFLTELHPNRPYLILELETYRGCTRDVFCSFCTEAFYGKPEFRSLDGILDEVQELYGMGNRYFRLGRQADLMTYLPNMNDFQNSFPRPIPDSLEQLYGGIRAAAPDLKLLHLDNINPGLISTFPDESRKIIEIICKYNTAGDTAAMGMESADPEVIKKNDLKASPEEIKRAIEIVNEFGAKRDQGLPRLLPGLNLLHGLAGESEKTFEYNYKFLKDILDSGLLLRRINIRQTVTYRNTRLDRMQRTGESKRPGKSERIHQRFIYYRDKIRKEIDHAFLLKNFPVGTLLHEVILESTNEGYYLGRPLGSYPVTVKIPLDDRQAAQYFENKTPMTCFVTGAEERSIRGLTFPLQVSRMGSIAFSQIPGIGRKASSRLFADLGLRKGNSESEIQNWLTEQGARLVPADSESPATAVSV
ncbi:MAG: radical SAM protein [Spirochaetaceae bacterium]|nr:radical SAM protein [Spirochaetaceae bacterium]|tara:strand:+ start:27029 stop:28807 length:1779 start_codon:yes stop_codon:yes gene_type:complete